MIYIGSRYERAEVFYTIDGRSGMTRPTVMLSPRPAFRSVQPKKAVRWQDGARLDRVSAKLVGSPELWWVLMDGNPDILDPLSIVTGSTVVLP